MSDKLTEIMAWKRQEIAPLVRTVSETELAQCDAALPRPPSFAAALRRRGAVVGTGRFGAHMEVELVNDGPVTVILDLD